MVPFLLDWIFKKEYTKILRNCLGLNFSDDYILAEINSKDFIQMVDVSLVGFWRCVRPEIKERI